MELCWPSFVRLAACISIRRAQHQRGFTVIYRTVTPFLACLALCAGAAAQTTTPASVAQRNRLEVTAQGAFLSESKGNAPVNTSSSAATTAGALWSHGSGALGWIGTAVSIGNRAS